MRSFHMWVLGILVTVFVVGLIGCSGGKKEAQKSAKGQVQTYDWFDGRPLYEVYVRAFSHAGDFENLREKLPELKRMGITTIWLMPVHPIGEDGRKGGMGCPYSVKDYFDVADEYGGLNNLEDLIGDAHSLGMRVMLDMVMNHVANDHVEMALHPDWYAQDSSGAFTREVADWSDVTDWNYDNPEVVTYLTRMLEYWAEEMDVDGFRCDVAAMVPDSFWKHVIPRIRKIKPDFFMLAEGWEPRLIDDGFQSVYDWDLYHRMKEHNEGGIDVDSLWLVIDRFKDMYPAGALPMRFIENHDENRSAEVFGWPQAKPYAALIFTLPGIPLIYSGQEVGATHRPSLFEKEPIDWDREGADEALAFYQDLLHMRQTSEILRKGDLTRIDPKDDADVLIFERSLNGKKVVVAINFTGQPYSTVLGPDLTVALEPYAYEVIER